MRKSLSLLILIGLFVLIAVAALAQEKKPAEAPKPAPSPSQEMLWMWNGIGGKLAAMAEDFPEDKYEFKATKDERTFAENLIHVAADNYFVISAIKGSPMGSPGNEDSIRKALPKKADIVKYVKQMVADGDQLIKAQGDSGLTREFKFPWGNMMVHVSFGWQAIIEHSGEHYGQLVVYYRLNGIVPPASRPKK